MTVSGSIVVGRPYRDGSLNRIAGDNSEIQRLVMAGSILR